LRIDDALILNKIAQVFDPEIDVPIFECPECSGDLGIHDYIVRGFLIPLKGNGIIAGIGNAS